MNICLITDQNYYKLTLMCINDIIIHKFYDTQICFHILTQNLDNELVTNFLKFKKYPNVDIKLYQNINISDYYKDFDSNKIITGSHVSQTALLKFLIPDILTECDICLYLDGDIKVVKDISEFYGKKLLNGKMAGVVKDFGLLTIWRDEENRLCKENKLFCSGQMLLDLDKLRNFKLSKKCFDVKFENFTDCPLMDQSVFNQVLENQVQYLPPRFMVSFHKMVQSYKGYDDIKMYNKIYGSNYSNIYQLLCDAILFHFHGDKKYQMKNTILKRLYEESEKTLDSFLKNN